MYLVKMFRDINDQEGVVIHTPFINGHKLTSGVITQGINAVDNMEIEMPMDNPGFGLIKPLKSLIHVINIKNQHIEFNGRIVYPEDDMETDGMHTQSWSCESELGYLHDAPQKHLEYRGSVFNLLKVQLDYFNSQVEPYKRFYIGNVTVKDPNDNIYIYLNAEESTFDSIKRTLVDRLGGELQVRNENGIRYLDYLQRIGHDSQEDIILSSNLISMSRKVDPTEIVSRLTPLGAKLEGKNGVVDSFEFLGNGTKVARVEIEDQNNLIDIPVSLLPQNTNVGSYLNVYGTAPNYIVTSSSGQGSTDAAQPRLSIDSINNGLPYLDRQDLIDEFGIQGGSFVWDDVNNIPVLKTKAIDWLEKQKIVLYQYVVEALDLFKIGKGVEEYIVGNTHRTINLIMSLNERLRIIGKSIDILDPSNSKLNIGDKFKSLLDYQIEQQDIANRVSNLQMNINNQSKQLGTLSQSYQNISQSVENVQTTLSNINAANLPTELNNINDSLEDIQLAIGNLPTYDLASPSNNGLLSKEDKSKLDSLKNYELATETKDGLMSKEDKKTLNNIGPLSLLATDDKTTIVAAINELNTRLSALEP